MSFARLHSKARCTAHKAQLQCEGPSQGLLVSCRQVAGDRRRETHPRRCAMGRTNKTTDSRICQGGHQVAPQPWCQALEHRAQAVCGHRWLRRCLCRHCHAPNWASYEKLYLQSVWLHVSLCPFSLTTFEEFLSFMDVWMKVSSLSLMTCGYFTETCKLQLKTAGKTASIGEE